MSTHNWWEFGKKGFKWAAVAGAVIGGAMAIGTGPIGILAAAAWHAVGWGLVGGTLGGIVGAFSRDKESEMISVQTPSGRVINVSAQELEQAQEQESTRYRDLVTASRGGQLKR